MSVSLIGRCLPISEFGVYQPAEMMKNLFKDNVAHASVVETEDLSKGASYTLALRGVQKVRTHTLTDMKLLVSFWVVML